MESGARKPPRFIIENCPHPQLFDTVYGPMGSLDLVFFSKISQRQQLRRIDLGIER